MLRHPRLISKQINKQSSFSSFSLAHANIHIPTCMCTHVARTCLLTLHHLRSCKSACYEDGSNNDTGDNEVKFAVLQMIIAHMKESGEMCVLVYFCLSVHDCVCVHISFQLWLCTRRRLLRNQECCASYFSSVQCSSVQLYCPCGEICFAAITKSITINSKHLRPEYTNTRVLDWRGVCCLHNF